MAKQSKTNSTVTTGLPSWQAGYVQGAFPQAQQIQANSPINVVGSDPRQAGILNQMIQLGQQPSSVASGAVNTFNQYLNGTNPWENQAYQQGANQVQSSMDSMFNRAGRINSGAEMNATANGLQNLAGNIYGEGQRYALANAGAVDQMPWQNLQNSLNATVQAQQLGQQNANAAYDAQMQRLGQYLGVVGNNQYGQQQTQPLYSSPLQQMLGGALTAAQTYAMLTNPAAAAASAAAPTVAR